MTEQTQLNFCALVPAYKEERHIAGTVENIRKFCPKVVVVDDGSGDTTAEEAEKAGAIVLKHEVNKGKGEALNTAIRYAQEQGFEFVLTMDADGQHAAEDIPAFLEAYRKNHTPVLVGNRMDNPTNMPWIRRQVNRFMSWLLSVKMKQFVPDTQSGYRLYHRDVLPFLMARSAGYAAESEVLLYLAEKGIRIGSVPIRVIYGDEVSAIRPFRDTIRFFSMLRRYDKVLAERKRASNG